MQREAFLGTDAIFLECIDAVELAVKLGTSYPEETCLFEDIQRTHTVVLAAVFCLHAASQLWTDNEATSYITNQLVQFT